MFICWTFWNIVAVIQVTGESAENIWFRILKPQNVTKKVSPTTINRKTRILKKKPSQKINLWFWKFRVFKIIWKPWALPKDDNGITCASVLACAVARPHWFSTCEKAALKKHDLKNKEACFILTVWLCSFAGVSNKSTFITLWTILQHRLRMFWKTVVFLKTANTFSEIPLLFRLIFLCSCMTT